MCKTISIIVNVEIYQKLQWLVYYTCIAMIFPFIEQLDLRQFEGHMEAKDNLFPQTLP